MGLLNRARQNGYFALAPPLSTRFRWLLGVWNGSFI